MPYRLKKGQKIKIETENGVIDEKTLTRTIDFTKKEIHCSPLTEHHNEGIPPSLRVNFPWGFRISEKWEDVDDWKFLFAEEAHYIRPNTARDAKTVVVEGSKSNQYTLTLDDDDLAIDCSCPARRFKKNRRGDCKHMDEWNYNKGRPIFSPF